LRGTVLGTGPSGYAAAAPGRPPQALQVGGNEPMVVKYDIRWADAGTNSFLEENNAPTIDAPATDCKEVEGDEPILVWGDGTRAG
jgi:hypothetical protein